MDGERLDVVDDGTPFETGNSTEIIIEEAESVEPLSIIVWCVGGVLLITLLSLLGRIILAKRKYPFENLDENEPSPRRRNNVFRIRIDGPEYTGYHNRPEPSYSDDPPEYQPAIHRSIHLSTENQLATQRPILLSTESQPTTQRPILLSTESQPTTQRPILLSTENQPATQRSTQPLIENQTVHHILQPLTPGHNVYHVRMRSYTGSNEMVTSGSTQNGGATTTQRTTPSNPVQHTPQDSNSAINRTPSVVPENRVASCSTLPVGRVANCSAPSSGRVAGRASTCASLSDGRVASLNGYLISPPSYQQVVSSNAPLPSVIVARQQRTAPRRIDFSL